jgi:NAD(P)-dependent dehydrogenase (short-subunit alcohol dehydrogenase family)
MQAYGASKLANILFTRELAKRLAGTAVTVNCLHPGVVRTHIGQYNWFARLIGQIVMRAIAVPVEEGAKTSLFLATAAEVEGRSGGYYKECAAIAPKPHALDESSGARLWEVSERLVGLAA